MLYITFEDQSGREGKRFLFRKIEGYRIINFRRKEGTTGFDLVYREDSFCQGRREY